MPSCQAFKNRLGNIDIGSITKLLEDHISSPSKDTEEALTGAMAALKQQREEFIQEYREKAKELLLKWYPYGGSLAQASFPSKITFEENTQRVAINGELDLGITSTTTPIDYFPSLLRKVDDLYIKGTTIPSLDYLEEANWLDAEGLTTLRSMMRLKKVGRLIIKGTSITTLDSLEEAGEIYAQDKEESSTPLASLMSLRKVNNLYAENSQLASLDALEEAGSLFLNGSRNLASLKRLRKAKFFQISHTQVTSLDALEIVEHLSAAGVQTLTSMANLRQADILALRDTKITTLDKLEEVETTLDAPRTLASMRSLRTAGDLLIADVFNLPSLPSLEAVHGSLVIPGIKALNQGGEGAFAKFFPNLRLIGDRLNGAQIRVYAPRLIAEIKQLIADGIIVSKSKIL